MQSFTPYSIILESNLKASSPPSTTTSSQNNSVPIFSVFPEQLAIKANIPFFLLSSILKSSRENILIEKLKKQKLEMIEKKYSGKLIYQLHANK